MGQCVSASRLINLDLLRLVSALMVVAAHYGFRMSSSGEGGSVNFPEIASISVWFESAIFIFFMISGYVISMSAAGRTARQFFAGRAARVWPIFFACATLTAIVMTVWPVPGHELPTIKQWLAHIVVVSRLLGQPFLDGAYWTIVYELIFYFWVLMLLTAGIFKSKWRTAVLVWLAISVINEAWLHNVLIERVFITKYSGCFMFGWVLHHQQQQATRNGVALLVLSALWAIATPLMIEPLMTNLYGVNRTWPSLLLLGLASVAIMTAATLGPSIRIKASAVTWVAALTYPIYLMHQNIGYAIFNRFGDATGRWGALGIVLATIGVTSWLLAHYFEPYCRPRLQKYLMRAMQPRPTLHGLKPA